MIARRRRRDDGESAAAVARIAQRLAVLLGAAPTPSRFGTVTARPGGGIAWQATGAVGQRYAAERSGNLVGWETVEVLDAVDGRMEGSLGVGPSDSPGFLRLRRRLE